jgi:hypothetical protein
MKKTLLFLIMQCVVASLIAQVHCGTERWDVKTLSDADTVNINFNQIVPTTIHDLISIPAPKSIKNDMPRQPEERIIYQIKCKIITFKKEDDKDIHLVLEDPETNETMVAEIPNPVCEGIQQTSRVKQFGEIYQWFCENIGEPTKSFKKLKDSPTVVISGPGFFDRVHGQTGVALNGREIHPVLSMEFAEPGPVEPIITKPNPVINPKSTNMETTTSPLNMLIIILLGAILGAAGQGIRVIVGMKKVYDQANKEKKDAKDLMEYKQMAFSLFIGFAVGAIAGVLAAVSSIDLQFSKSLIIAFITAGYAGTDFIEGFMKKNTEITKGKN